MNDGFQAIIERMGKLKICSSDEQYKVYAKGKICIIIEYHIKKNVIATA